MKPKIKDGLQLFLIITFSLSMLYVIGRMGALEVDIITIGQAVSSCSIALVYMVIAVITYKIIGKEE